MFKDLSSEFHACFTWVSLEKDIIKIDDLDDYFDHDGILHDDHHASNDHGNNIILINVNCLLLAECLSACPGCWYV